MATALGIAERRIGPVTLLELNGRLVADDGDRIFMARVSSLVSAGCTDILVDLRNVSYIDSAGVGSLVAMYLRVLNRSGRFKLLCPSQRACHVLQITHLNHVFEVFEREAEALASFSAAVRIPPDVQLGMRS